MERRAFLKAATATAAVLAAQGQLPLLAAQRKGRGGRKNQQVSRNPFTEPCAIEPVTGYLPSFALAAGAAMAGDFKASYSLVSCSGAGAKSKNSVSGAMEVAFRGDRCSTVETRKGGHNALGSRLSTSLELSGRLKTVSRWSLESSVDGRSDLGFSEKGSWDGRATAVKSKSWTQNRETRNPLIARWALLPLLSSGMFKKDSLTFDLLDDSTLRPNQRLSYEGEIEVPVKGGKAKLISYLQTGQGIVPTHYLVDGEGRVQLITMSTVNWALTGVE